MSPEDNKALARRWLEEVWNKGDLSLIDELIAPNYPRDAQRDTGFRLKRLERTFCRVAFSGEKRETTMPLT